MSHSISDDDDRDIENDSEVEDDDLNSLRGDGSDSVTKRAHHNALERKRRNHIKDSFKTLRDCVPGLAGKKVSRAQVLEKAANYILMKAKRLKLHQKDLGLLKLQSCVLEQQIIEMHADDPAELASWRESIKKGVGRKDEVNDGEWNLGEGEWEVRGGEREVRGGEEEVDEGEEEVNEEEGVDEGEEEGEEEADEGEEEDDGEEDVGEEEEVDDGEEDVGEEEEEEEVDEEKMESDEEEEEEEEEEEDPAFFQAQSKRKKLRRW